MQKDLECLPRPYSQLKGIRCLIWIMWKHVNDCYLFIRSVEQRKSMTLLQGFEPKNPQTSKHNIHVWDLYSELVFTYRKIVDEIFLKLPSPLGKSFVFRTCHLVLNELKLPKIIHKHTSVVLSCGYQTIQTTLYSWSYNKHCMWNENKRVKGKVEKCLIPQILRLKK